MDLIPFPVTNLCLESYFIRITSRSRIIYWIIIGMIVSGLSVLPFVYVDVSVQARGYFQSDTEKQIIYTPFQGKVFYTSIRKGNKVSKGDTLLIIDSETIQARKFSIFKRIDENNASISDLVLLTSNDYKGNIIVKHRLVTQKYQAEYAN